MIGAAHPGKAPSASVRAGVSRLREDRALMPGAVPGTAAGLHGNAGAVTWSPDGRSALPRTLSALRVRHPLACPGYERRIVVRLS